jgi:hypothetical protein
MRVECRTCGVNYGAEQVEEDGRGFEVFEYMAFHGIKAFRIRA